jgi:uncharacterized RDD family membrane protein YckC
MSSQSLTSQENPPSEPIYTFPPIAGFWQRFAAWLVDILLLGLAGQIIGWTLSVIWFQIGPYGRLVGLPFIICYFGLMNSRIGNGQTIGKRCVKIAVRDRNNQPISLGRSLLRISILAIPMALNGWQLPFFQSVVLQWLVAVIVFGVGSAIFYTMIFNRRARQGLHDLACGTYVVRLMGGKPPIESFPKTARVHLMVSGALIVLAMIGTAIAGLVGQSFVANIPLAPIYVLYQTLQTDSRFFTVSVHDNTLYSSQGKTSHILQIQVWYKGVPSNEERARVINDIARVTLANTENISRYDLLRIDVTSAFDLGFATGHISIGDGQPIEVWQQRVMTGTP